MAYSICQKRKTLQISKIKCKKSRNVNGVVLFLWHYINAYLDGKFDAKPEMADAEEENL